MSELVKALRKTVFYGDERMARRASTNPNFTGAVLRI